MNFDSTTFWWNCVCEGSYPTICSCFREIITIDLVNHMVVSEFASESMQTSLHNIKDLRIFEILNMHHQPSF